MKLIIAKDNLISAVMTVSKAVPSKTTMPILECILINAATEKIKLTANDTELGIETTVAGEIAEHGVIAVPADIFTNIVRKLPDGDVRIDTKDETVTIRCGQSRFTIQGRDGQDFTQLPEVDREYAVEITQFTLRDIINKTLFSASTNDSNKIMTGELFEVRDKTLRVIALDGHRIAIRSVELRQSYDNEKAIIPGKTLSEISKILGGDTEKTAKIYFSDKYVLFAFDETIVVSRLIDGEYFMVDQMLSKDYSTHFRIKRQDLLSSLDRSVLLVKEEDKKPIIFLITDGNLELRISSTIGSMDENLVIEKDGQDLNIGFNPKFLIDALRAIDEEEVDIYLQSSRAPAFIRDDSTYCYLVLPVNFISID
jgi:DNA polymerase-3 subunit beta